MEIVKGFTEESTAHYFHSPLYRFTAIARAAVINAFYAKIGDIAAKCSYNAKRDLFSLDCPTSQGPFCDEQLYNVISEFIEEELQSAKREERKLRVQQFAESKREWDADRDDELESTVDEDAPPAARPPIVTTHTVVGPDECKLKFFRMYQLPESLLQRLLSQKNDATHGVVVKGWTCRAVRWKAKEGFVFNGRDGTDCVYSSSEYQQLDFPDFPGLNDTRDKHTLNALDLTEEKVAPAYQDHVDEWRNDLENFEQVSPDKAADPPKATRKLLAADEMHSSGRPRVPKGHTLAMEEPDCSSDDEPTAPMVKTNFVDEFLSGRPGHVTLESNCSDSDESADSDSSVNTAGRGMPRALFSSLMPESEISKPLETMPGSTTATSTAVQTLSRMQPSQKLTEPVVTASKALQSAIPPGNMRTPPEFKEYDKKYAVVDNYGLTVNTSLSASYAMENSNPAPMNPKRQPIVPRMQKPYVPTVRDDIGTATSGRHNARPALNSAACPTTLTARDSMSSVASVPWEQNITSGRVPTAALIDVRSAPSLRPLTVPPGLMTSSQKDRQQDVISMQQMESDSLVDAADIDLMDRSPPRSSTISRPLVGQILQPGIPEHKKTARGDVTTDKLAVFPSGFARKRNTMNQKAGKNIKSKGKKPSSANNKKTIAQLPMPDPLPVPRVKKVVEELKSGGGRNRTPAAGPPVQRNRRSPTNNFKQIVLDTIETQSTTDHEDDEDASEGKGGKLVVKFCQLLLLPDEAQLGKQEASTTGVCQNLINASKIITHYFPRLTTSASDAHVLIKLMGAEKTPNLEYEVRMKDAADRTLMCTIPAANKAMFTVRSREDASGYEFLHYPVHVWDARMVLFRHSANYMSPSHDAVVQFVSSMTTEGNAPSFCAHVDTGKLTVEAVYAHRVFERAKDGVTFRVIEKQLLQCDDPRGGGRHNFHAAAFAEGEMIYYHRLWWEAMLETEDLEKREELLAITTSMVEKLDGIGIENEGPWDRADEDETIVAPVLLYDDLGRKHLAKLKGRV